MKRRCAAGPAPAFKSWADEERRNATVRDRLRRLLLPAATVDSEPLNTTDDVRIRGDSGTKDDDVATREMVYDILCCTASFRLHCFALTVKTEAPAEYASVVDALLRGAPTTTLGALDRHFIARSVGCRPPERRGSGSSPVGDRSPTAPGTGCAIAAMPVACLALTGEYLSNLWRLAAVCRQWWRYVRDTPLHLSHHLEFALRRCDACTRTSTVVADPFDGPAPERFEALYGLATIGEKTRTQSRERERIEQEILVRTLPPRFRARTTHATFRAPAFLSVPAVAHFLKHLVALREVAITVRVDDTRSFESTKPLDALNHLPHLGTLRITIDHVLDRPGDCPMHIPELPSLTHLDCRTRALAARSATATAIPALAILCKSLRVLRLRGRDSDDTARVAVPIINWEDAQALEDLTLDYRGVQIHTGQDYELVFWSQCVDIEAKQYEREAVRDFAGATLKSTRFARSMQRLRRLQVAGAFAVPPHLGALEALRFGRFLGLRQETWSALPSLRSVRGRVYCMSEAVALALSAPPNVTRVDLEVCTSRATESELAAMREFAARLEAAGGVLMWNGNATFPKFFVMEKAQEEPESDAGGSDDEDEFSDDGPTSRGAFANS